METKTTLKVFTICEYEKEQAYLRRMHGSGWKLMRMSWPCAYHFEKCSPEDVIYQLDYNQEGIAHRDEYVRMFSDCGWEYLQDFYGYSYFRKPASQMDGVEEIFCDESSRLQMMERVFRGRMIPLLALFLGVLLPGAIRTFCQGELLLAGGLAAIIALYLKIFVSFVRQYSRFRKRA